MKYDNLIDNDIIICPNLVKKDILNYFNICKKVINVKFLSKKELKQRYYFSFNSKTIYYLMNKYNFSYDYTITILNNLYYIKNDVEDSTLSFLRNIRKELDDNGLLIYDELFKNIFINRRVVVIGYDYLEIIIQDILFYLNGVCEVLNIPKTYSNKRSVLYEFGTIVEEVEAIASIIKDNISKGVNINNIKILELPDNYKYLVKKIFKLYGIPINLKDSISLSNTLMGNYFINNISYNIDDILDNLSNRFDLNNDFNKVIYNKIVNICNEYYFEDDKRKVRELLVNDLKNSYIDDDVYVDAVSVEPLFDNVLSHENYYYMLGFNDTIVPKIFKDEDYLSDKIKCLINLEDSNRLNNIYKALTIKIINGINHLVLSYKKSENGVSFEPSILINKLNTTKVNYEKIYNSRIINKITINRILDSNNDDKILGKLVYNYGNIYNTYDNKYICNKDMDSNNILNLSYSKINQYYNCPFAYYLEYVLKLNKNDETFSTFIGSLIHDVIENSDIDNFDLVFDSSFNKIKSEKNYEFKSEELFLLLRIKEETKLIVNTIKNNMESIKDRKDMYEKNIIVDINDKTKFLGYIDHIIENDNGLILIDYKTGSIDINIKNFENGLSSQLPSYLYLISKDPELCNKKIIGFYYVSLFDGIKKSELNISYSTIREESLKYQGFTIGDVGLVKEFFSNTDIIKNYKINIDGSISKNSKIISDGDIDKINKHMEYLIKAAEKNIRKYEFSIKPKTDNKDINSCTYCKYKSICYKQRNDYEEIIPNSGFDFLGGSNNEVE